MTQTRPDTICIKSLCCAILRRALIERDTNWLHGATAQAICDRLDVSADALIQEYNNSYARKYGRRPIDAE